MSLETTEIWPDCRRILKGEIPEKLFNTWILPIHSIEKKNSIRLLAPNNFVLKKVQNVNKTNKKDCWMRARQI